MHAILQRGFTKVWDLFDQICYLNDRNWPAPNLGLLNSTLEQSGWSGTSLTANSWRDAMSDAVEDLDWRVVHNDVQPFIESPDELQILAKEDLLSLLR